MSVPRWLISIDSAMPEDMLSDAAPQNYEADLALEWTTAHGEASLVFENLRIQARSHPLRLNWRYGI